MELPHEVSEKEVDHILTRSRDKSLFLSCRARRVAEAPANTDHVLVTSEMRIATYKPRKQQGPARKFDTTRLTQEPALQLLYNVTVQNKFDLLDPSADDDIDGSWNPFCSTIKSAVTEVIGMKKTIRKPWLSAETFAVIVLKADAKKKNDHAERKRLQSVFRAKAKEDRESYLNKLAKEAEEGIRSSHLGPAFRAIRSLTGSRSAQVTPVINKADGSPCNSQAESLQRWQEHFEAALNH